VVDDQNKSSDKFSSATGGEGGESSWLVGVMPGIVCDNMEGGENVWLRSFFTVLYGGVDLRLR